MWLEEKVHKILDFVCVLQEVDWFGYCIVVGPEAGVQKKVRIRSVFSVAIIELGHLKYMAIE